MANSWQPGSEATWWNHPRNMTFTNVAIGKKSWSFHFQQGSDQSLFGETEGGLGQETQIRVSRILPGQIMYRPHHNSSHHHLVVHQCISLSIQHSWILRRPSKFVQRNHLEAGTPPPKSPESVLIAQASWPNVKMPMHFGLVCQFCGFLPFVLCLSFYSCVYIKTVAVFSQKS